MQLFFRQLTKKKKKKKVKQPLLKKQQVSRNCHLGDTRPKRPALIGDAQSQCHHPVAAEIAFNQSTKAKGTFKLEKTKYKKKQ